MAQQTALQFFLMGLIDLEIGKGVPTNKQVELHKLFEQAKAMEKEQMHKCASFWRGKENAIEKPIFEQYYNEQYGSNN